MLVLERQNAILEVLGEKGSVRVSELATRFDVTEETIRRDLDRLEEDGKLKRSHGGAVIVSGGENQETPYWFREITHEKEKATIARHALLHVKEGDSIILDASTTAWHMAKRLRDMDITVVTNSVRVVIALAEHEKVNVISVGGKLAKRSLSFVGTQAEEDLAAYHVDKLFLSCAGVDLERGLSDLSDEQASMRRCMLTHADKRFLLVDHSKFGVKALSVVGGLEMFDEIITDEETSADTLQRLGDMNAKVRVVGA